MAAQKIVFDQRQKSGKEGYEDCCISESGNILTIVQYISMFRFWNESKRECENFKNDSTIFLLHEHSAVCHETSGWSVRCGFIADLSRHGREQCNEKR